MNPDHNAATQPARALRRADLAQASGCNLETIRYYEGVDLLPAPARTMAGHRTYGAEDVRRLRFILRARELGFSLSDIRGLLGLGNRALLTCAEVKEKTEQHLTDIRGKIVDLQRIEAVLSRTASLCTGADRPECAVLDSLRH